MPTLIPSKILSKIADFTGHRDLGLLEASLLKTVDEMFAPEWSTIYRVEMPGDHASPPEFSSALEHGKPVTDPFAESFCDLLDLEDVVAVPILSRARLVLGHVAVKRKGGLNEQEQNQIAAVFRIYDNYLEVLREAQVDKLTGLLNRHTFDTQLEQALELARRGSRKSSNPSAADAGQAVRMFLGEIDIDHFKRVNDNFGHLYGDEVLLIVAQLMLRNFRKNDLVYRFGGEEFVVIVASDDLRGAIESFERLRKTIEEHPFPQVGQVTISIGITELRDAAMPVQLLGHADQALYYAKEHGRNQVCFYEDLVSSQSIIVKENSGELILF